MTSRPARPRTLLDFINRPILKGVAPAGNLKRVFTGKSGQNRKKIFGRVMYASETIQNCKNPTGHIDWIDLINVNEGHPTRTFKQKYMLSPVHVSRSFGALFKAYLRKLISAICSVVLAEYFSGRKF